MISKEAVVFGVEKALRDVLPPIIDMEGVVIRQLGSRAFKRAQAPLLVPIRERIPVSPDLKRRTKS